MLVLPNHFKAVSYVPGEYLSFPLNPFAFKFYARKLWFGGKFDFATTILSKLMFKFTRIYVRLPESNESILLHKQYKFSQSKRL